MAEIKLYAYKIENHIIRTGSPTLIDGLKCLMSDEKSVSDRKKSSSNKEEVLAYYKFNDNSNRFLGIMMELSPMKSVVRVKQEILNDKTINPEELNTTRSNDLICKNIYYFMADKETIVISLSPNYILEFESYINWLLESYSNTSFHFSIMYNIPYNKIDPTQIKNIRLTYNNSLSTKIQNGITLEGFDSDPKPPLEFNFGFNSYEYNVALKTINAVISLLHINNFEIIEIYKKSLFRANPLILKKQAEEIFCSKIVNINSIKELSDVMNKYLNELKNI